MAMDWSKRRRFLSRSVGQPVISTAQRGLKGQQIMFSEVTSQLRNRAAWLISGRYDLIVAAYCLPLPVDLAANRLIVRDADEAIAMLRLQRSVFLDRGVVGLTPSVTAMDLLRAGRFRLWVDWHELAVSENDLLQSKVIYYCPQTPTGFRIEMVDYASLAMPGLQPRLAELALSA